MSENTFSVSDVISLAWAKVSGVKGTFFAVLLTLIFIQFCNSMISSMLNAHPNPVVAIVLIIVSLGLSVLYLMLLIGMMYLGIHRAIDRPIAYGMVKEVFKLRLFLRIIGTGFVQFLIFLPAIVFIILSMISAFQPQAGVFRLFFFLSMIVGIYIGLRLKLTTAIIIAEELGVWPAIEKSYRATQSCVWQLLGLNIVNALILFISCIPLGIGLIWALPYYFINYGIVYRKLLLGR